jgi:prolyl-tRNA editing enzyme YbaK/EbsC (Cys-tRNA(Pro) deacylase)
MNIVPPACAYLLLIRTLDRRTGADKAPGEDGRVQPDHLVRVSPAARPDLLAVPVRAAVRALPDGAVTVAEIDPVLADTAEFCARYGVPLDASANCVVVLGRRGEEERWAACVVLATTRTDVNGTVRRRLGARKASFAPVTAAVERTAMEYGGITPLGLPPDWAVYVDAAVAAAPEVVVGSGLRRSKLWLAGVVLAGLPGAAVVEGLGR